MRPVTCELRGTACDLHAARCDLRPSTPEYDSRVRKCRKRAAKEGAQEMCVFKANPLGARAFTGALVGDAWGIGFPKSIGFYKGFLKKKK